MRRHTVCDGAHRPAGSEGKATDLSFFSSAAERQFFTVFSSWSSHFSEPHCGMLQWMMKRAAMPLAWLTATAGWKHVRVTTVASDKNMSAPSLTADLCALYLLGQICMYHAVSSATSYCGHGCDSVAVTTQLRTWCYLQRPLCFPQLLNSFQELSTSSFFQGVAWKTSTAAAQHEDAWKKPDTLHEPVLLTHSIFEVQLCIGWVNYSLHLDCSNFTHFTFC